MQHFVCILVYWSPQSNSAPFWPCLQKICREISEEEEEDERLTDRRKTEDGRRKLVDMRATTLGRLARHTLETRQPPTRLLSTTTFFNKNNSKFLGLTLRREHRRRRQRQRQTFDISNSDNTGPSYRLRAASTSSSDARPDGIVVLAGGLTSEGSLPKWVVGRLDAAVALHEQNPGSKILCTGGGTPHKPPILFDNGHVNHESTVSILSFCHARTHREEAFEKLKSDFFLLLLPPLLIPLTGLCEILDREGSQSTVHRQGDELLRHDRERILLSRHSRLASEVEEGRCDHLGVSHAEKQGCLSLDLWSR